MLANISLVTLGVEDLRASTRFDERLGWRRATASQDDVTFLQGHAVALAALARPVDRSWRRTPASPTRPGVSGRSRWR